jgi:3-dehydroquinate synthase
MNHGEAVAVGLAYIADAAQRGGLLSAEDKQRIICVLEKAGFVLTPPVEMRCLLKEVKKDKKSEGDDIYVVLPRAIGDCIVEKMPLEEFKALCKA